MYSISLENLKPITIAVCFVKIISVLLWQFVGSKITPISMVYRYLFTGVSSKLHSTIGLSNTILYDSVAKGVKKHQNSKKSKHLLLSEKIKLTFCLPLTPNPLVLPT